MTRKTPADFALWAALPMAHTSQIEGRLKMILDRTRRRTSPRRFLLLSAVTGAAALVPLSMLQPMAKAQIVSQSAQGAAENGTVQLVGIFNIAVPDAEWDANGAALSAPVINREFWQAGIPITAKPGQKALFFAFHLPRPMQNTSTLYDVSGTTLDGITMTQMKRDKTGEYHLLSEITMRSMELHLRNELPMYGAAFPASLLKTDVRVGTASGTWTTALLVQLVEGNGIEETHSRDPRSKLDMTHAFDRTNGKIVYSMPTKTPDDFQNFRVILADKKGHSSVLGTINAESRGTQEVVTIYLPHTLSQVQAIRIESRPLTWTEFKNVALQPVKP